MNIKCKKIIVHNFGSYNHAEIDLLRRGYCAVIGENHYKKDNALSNGSGKSMLWSAICYALTGETISGISTNLHNINITDDQDCYVTLEFDVDTDHYKITRYHTPKSMLHIFKNNADISGKGIRESNKILTDHLPDLNKNLIATCLIIGQGMPNKFSSFSPSGRKELLEKLTKSDFMLDDTKERLQTRQTELAKQLRQTEDRLLVNKTTLSNTESNLSTAQLAVTNFKFKDYDNEIDSLTKQIETLEQGSPKLTESIKTKEQELSEINNQISQIESERISKLSAENNTHTNNVLNEQNKRSELSATINSSNSTILNLNALINKMRNIKDVCPTCGQKIPGVIKPDTSEYEAQLQSARQALNEASSKIAVIENNLRNFNNEHAEALNNINSEYNKKTATLRSNTVKLNTELTSDRKALNNLNTQVTELKSKISNLLYAKEHDQKDYEELQQKVQELSTKQSELIQENTDLLKSKADIDAHVSVVKKIEILIKRDFRGYLLTGIISYIDKRAKEYSQIVFGTDELKVYLDGNNLDISYCNKMLDNLSGGERQRVDLILQFAIRDMLSKYLNYNSNILVLDEIFDNLDRVATAKILELISTKLSDVESVFIISHHSDSLDIAYDSELKIIKNENGISEVY